MKQILFAALLLAAAPCLAEVKDQAAAIAALNSASAKDRLEAIHYLALQKDQVSYEALAGRFQTEKDAYLRVQIVEALDVQGSTWAYSCAMSAADDGNKAVRQAAAPMLAPLAGTPAGYKKLKAMAADPDADVRMALVNSLAVDHSTAAVSIIGTVLTDKKGPLGARRLAASRLSEMNTKEADTELLKHLSDGDPQIKAAAAARKPKKGGK